MIASFVSRADRLVSGFSVKASNGSKTFSIKFDKSKNNMIALFIIAIAAFAYICYALLKPEKF